MALTKPSILIAVLFLLKFSQCAPAPEGIMENFCHYLFGIEDCEEKNEECVHGCEDGNTGNGDGFNDCDTGCVYDTGCAHDTGCGDDTGCVYDTGCAYDTGYNCGTENYCNNEFYCDTGYDTGYSGDIECGHSTNIGCETESDCATEYDIEIGSVESSDISSSKNYEDSSSDRGSLSGVESGRDQSHFSSNKELVQVSGSDQSINNNEGYFVESNEDYFYHTKEFSEYIEIIKTTTTTCREITRIHRNYGEEREHSDYDYVSSEYDSSSINSDNHSFGSRSLEQQDSKDQANYGGVQTQVCSDEAEVGGEYDSLNSYDENYFIEDGYSGCDNDKYFINNEHSTCN